MGVFRVVGGGDGVVFGVWLVVGGMFVVFFGCGGLSCFVVVGGLCGGLWLGVCRVFWVVGGWWFGVWGWWDVRTACSSAN